MGHLTDNDSAIQKERWRAWVEKGRQNDMAMAHKARIFGGVVFVAIAGAAAYFIAIR